MKKVWVVIWLTGLAGLGFAQQTTLDQAIQVVREWLGDQQAVVEFMFSHTPDDTIGLFGPSNKYVFWTVPYIVDVDINSMKVTGWTMHPSDYVFNARIDLPLLSEDQIKKITQDYSQQHFPYWNEFPNWEILKIEKYLLKYLDNTGNIIKKAWDYGVLFHPYFTNDKGQRILMLSTGCGVGIDPYTGNITGFSYSYMPMTLTNLLPNFSADEAKTRIEQTFLNMGATKANAIMSSPAAPYNEIPDGLVLGATGTSGLRLAYLFDYIVTVGSPEHPEFGSEDEPAIFTAAIDAHTGELLFLEYISGSLGEKRGEIFAKKHQSHSFSLWKIKTKGIKIGIGLIVIACLLFIWRRHKREKIQKSSI